jgi:hypothetical protein
MSINLKHSSLLDSFANYCYRRAADKGAQLHGLIPFAATLPMPKKQ